MIALLLRNIDGLANPLLRWTHRAVRNTSFRLTKMHEKWVTRYLRRQLSARVSTILMEYDSANMTFGQTRDALKHLMQTVGKIEYKQ